MIRLSPIFMAMAVFGCQSPLQAYIDEHTDVENTYGEDHQITVAAENGADLDDSAMTDLLWVQRHIAETVLPDDDGLKHVTVFLPATDESFFRARECIIGVGDSAGIAFITPESRTVVFSPKTWRERSREYVVKTYIHELTHYVALRIDGDMDADHSNPAYWGDGGLVSIIYDEWQKRPGTTMARADSVREWDEYANRERIAFSRQ